MGDDIEMSKRLRLIKDALLQADNTNLSHKHQAYTLEREFTRSKFNRNYTVIIVISALILLMVLISFSFHIYMRNQETNITIDAGDFDEIKLKELLSSVVNSNVQLEMLQSELEEIENDYESKRATAILEFERQKKNLILKNNTDALSTIETEQRQLIKLLEDEFLVLSKSKKTQITELETKIGLVQDDVNSFSDGVDALVLNPEQHLQQLRLNKLANYYEQKLSQLRTQFSKEKQVLIERYNPEFSEKSLTQILDKPVKTVPDSELLKTLEQIKETEQVSTETLSEIELTQQKQKELLQRLEKIPYINSPQSASAHLNGMTATLNDSYNKTVLELSEQLQKTKQTLTSYEYFLQQQVFTQGEVGYVIDPRELNDIKLYLDRSFSVEAGDRVLIFRQDDELIAQLEYYMLEQTIKLKLIELSDGKTLRPMDKVFLIQQRLKQ